MGGAHPRATCDHSLSFGVLLLSRPAVVGKFVATAVLELAHDHAAATAGTPLCTFFGLIGQFAGVAATAWNAMLGTNHSVPLYPAHADPARCVDCVGPRVQLSTCGS